MSGLHAGAEHALEVVNLRKRYPGFLLEDVSFNVEPGHIMGLIGRNGAGKTTIMKCLLNLVHTDAGAIRFFGKDMSAHEGEIKQRIGFTAGGTNYYVHRTLAEISAITKTFYDSWDENAYRRYLREFDLDERKKPLELSEGMKVKYYLSLALSHHAGMLILDEPTSGLDPVSRDELLEIFMKLAAEGTAILFSTHITSDIEKCADDITYIRDGQLLTSMDRQAFAQSYRLVAADKVSDKDRNRVISVRHSKSGDTALIHVSDEGLFADGDITMPDLQDIMVHLEASGRKEGVGA